eukprot:9969175-Alexandrium_andersonii.AAC.1
MKFSTTSKIRVVPGENEIVPVHDAPDAQLRAAEAAARLAFPRANPKLSRTEVHSSSQRAGAARAP